MCSRPLFVSVGFLTVIGVAGTVATSVSRAAVPASAANNQAALAAGPIGRVTAAFGAMSIQGPAGRRGGDLQSLLYDDDLISTDAGGVTVLLASRVVLKIDANSAVAVSEGVNQTNLVLA